jgi:hypothetical protein
MSKIKEKANKQHTENGINNIANMEKIAGF